MKTARSNSTLQFAQEQGERGVTARELGDHLGTHHGSASGALSNLHRKGELLRLTERRGGQSVYVLPAHQQGRPLVPPRINASSLTGAERAMIESYRNRDKVEPEPERDDDQPQELPEPEPGHRWVRLQDFNSIEVGDRILVSFYESDVRTVRSGKVAKIRGGFAFTSSGAIVGAYRFTRSKTGKGQDTRPEVGWWRQAATDDKPLVVWARDADASLIGHTVQFTTTEHGLIDTVLYGIEHRTVRGAKVGDLESSVSLLLLDESVTPTWYDIPSNTRLLIDAD